LPGEQTIGVDVAVTVAVAIADSDAMVDGVAAAVGELAPVADALARADADAAVDSDGVGGAVALAVALDAPEAVTGEVDALTVALGTAVLDTLSLPDSDAEVVLESCSVERPLSRTATSETTNASSHSNTPLGNAGSPRDASYRAQSPHVPLPTAHAPADQKPFDWDTRMAAHELLFLGAPHGIPE
jgi:hypothetical protein